MLTLKPFSRRIMVGRLCSFRIQPQLTKVNLYFHSALGGEPRALAHMLDSLVRVSRRGDERHFVRVLHSLDGLTLAHTGLTPSPKQIKKPNLLIANKVTTSQHYLPSVPFQQFQVLFNSLFKVLCIFPSRYLFAIGLPPIFSFRWNLPPT